MSRTLPQLEPCVHIEWIHNERLGYVVADGTVFTVRLAGLMLTGFTNRTSCNVARLVPMPETTNGHRHGPQRLTRMYDSAAEAKLAAPQLVAELMSKCEVAA
jgi:hypothetical protein